MKDRANLTYKMMQGCYWLLYCCFFGYITYFMLERNYATATIGIICAIAGTVSSVGQPVLGRIADRTKAGWKIPHIILLVLEVVLSALLIVVKSDVASGLLFSCGIILLGWMMPLLNAASFNCSRAGHNIDFGKARGIGSITYAVLSVILGKLTVAYGEWVIPIASLIIGVIYIFVVLRLPQYSNIELAKKAEASKVSVDKAIAEPQEKEKSFIAKYPAFMVMVLAGTCFMTFHNMTNSYMIQMFTDVNGNSNNLGVAHAIAAVSELPIMFTYAKLCKKIKSRHLLIVSGIGFALKAVMYLVSFNVGTIYLTQFFQLISFAIFGSGSVYYAEEVCSAEDKATGQAFMSSTIAAGYVIGSLLGGWLVTELGVKGMEGVGIGVAALGAIFAIISNIIEGRKHV